MNTSSQSDFSSGCESGWTQYFVQTSSSKSRRTGRAKKMYAEFQEEGYRGGEEDLSMVSDASSGPRQHYDDVECFDLNEYHCSSSQNYGLEGMRQVSENGKQRSDRSHLDDTATSHSKKNKKPSMYYNPSHGGQENSGASLPRAKPSRKKFFGS